MGGSWFRLTLGFWRGGCGLSLTPSRVQRYRLGFAFYLGVGYTGLPTNVVAAVMCLVFTGLNLLGAKRICQL